jgi:hypothetical protein
MFQKYNFVVLYIVVCVATCEYTNMMANAKVAGDSEENPIKKHDDVLDIHVMTDNERAVIHYFDCKFIFDYDYIFKFYISIV